MIDCYYWQHTRQELHKDPLSFLILNMQPAQDITANVMIGNVAEQQLRMYAVNKKQQRWNMRMDKRTTVEYTMQQIHETPENFMPASNYPTQWNVRECALPKYHMKMYMMR
jgi:hypothetical protein